MDGFAQTALSARKSASQGFVVSLSGGADSSAVAALVATTWRLAELELGEKYVRALFGMPRDVNVAGYIRCFFAPTAGTS